MNGLGVNGYQGRPYTQRRRDSVTLSAAARQRAAQLAQAGDVSSAAPADPEQRLGDLLDSLQKAYPSVNIMFGELGSEAEVREFASSPARGGITLVISREYLRGVSSEEAMSVIGKALSQLSDRVGALCPGKIPRGVGIAVGENGKLSFWATFQKEEKDPAEQFVQQQLDALKEHMERMLAKKQENKIKLKKKVSYNAMDDVSRLIKARTVRDARSMVSKLYARQFLLKQGKENYEDGQVEATLAQIDGIILRAKVKVKKLNEEARLERRQKRAVKENQDERARVLREELRKKRTARKSREYAQVYAASPYLAGLLHKPESEWEDTLAGQDGAALGIPGAVSGAFTGALAPAAPVAAAPAAVNVVVATGIDLAI